MLALCAQAGACQLFPQEEWAHQPGDDEFAALLQNEEEEEMGMDEGGLVDQIWRLQAGGRQAGF
jgi:hypothetical protein